MIFGGRRGREKLGGVWDLGERKPIGLVGYPYEVFVMILFYYILEYTIQNSTLPFSRRCAAHV